MQRRVSLAKLRRKCFSFTSWNLGPMAGHARSHEAWIAVDHRLELVSLVEASYEANDRLVAARPAKRVSLVLACRRSRGCSGPFACIACSQPAKGLWLRQLAIDVRELAIDFGSQGTHSSDRSQSD